VSRSKSSFEGRRGRASGLGSLIEKAHSCLPGSRTERIFNWKRGYARRLSLEPLEDRSMLAAIMFVDFGDNFAGGTLNTTQGAFRDVAGDPNPNNRILGTELLDNANNFNAGTQLNIVRQNFTTPTRAQMMDVIRRAYQPLDVTVVELTATPQLTSDGRNVAAAASMADVINTLRGGNAAFRDAYVFVGLFVVDPGGANQRTYGNNGGGNSPGDAATGGTMNQGVNTDLTAAANIHDDVAAVFTNGTLGDFNTTNNISHEAGHLFGLQHSLTNSSATASIGLFHQAEIMSYLNTNVTTSSMFTRYPMIRGNNNSPAANTDPVNYNDLAARAGQTTLFDQLRADGNVGANPNFTFVSGTGANDIITIARSGANANVTIQAFADAAFTSAITVPGVGGASFNYSFPLTNTILVYGGGSNDRFVIDADLGVNVQVDGMLGTDTFILNGKGAASVVYTPNPTSPNSVDLLNPSNGVFNNVADFGATINIGGNSIVLRDFEIAGSVTIQNVTTVNYLTPLANVDSLVASRSAGGLPQVTGTVNGGTQVVPLLLSTVNKLAVTTGGSDDTFTLNNGNGLVVLPAGIDFNGGGGTDRLVFTKQLVGGTIARETYRAGATQDAGTWTLDPDGNMGPGANGATNGDEEIVNFIQLELTDSSATATVFDGILNGLNNDATVADGGVLDGVNSLQVTDNNNTFVTFRFANKTTARIMGQSGGDAITVDYTTDAAGLTALQIFGHVATDVIGQPVDDNATDTLAVLRNTLVPVTLFGQGGNDEFIVGNGDLTQIHSAVTIDAGAGTDDLLEVIDSGRATAVDYFVDPTTIAICADPANINVARFDSTLERAQLDGTQGINQFDVTPSVATQFFIDGNLPNTLPGDFLSIRFEGTTNPQLTNNNGNGLWTFGNRKAVLFEEIERFNFFPILVYSADASTLGKPTVKVVDAQTGGTLLTFLAYEKSFKQGVRVAMGDVTGDGIPEIITAPGYNRAPDVKVFQFSTNGGPLAANLLQSFSAYSKSYTGGVNVAVGDVNGDTFNDIVVSPSRGVSEIRAYLNQQTATPFNVNQRNTFLAFDRTFIGGATVAAGDVLGTGTAEIIVGSGSGMRATVRVFDGLTNSGLTTPAASVGQILPFATTFRGGVSVAVANLNADANFEIVVGAGVGGGSQLAVYDSTNFGTPTATPAAPYSGTNSAVGPNAPLRIAALSADLNGDGVNDLFVAQGPDGRSQKIRRVPLAGAAVDFLMENAAEFRNGFYLATDVLGTSFRC
jgi:hypothetical protein